MKDWLKDRLWILVVAILILLTGVAIGATAREAVTDPKVTEAPTGPTPLPNFTVVSVVSYTGMGERQGMYATVLVEGRAYEHYIAGLGGPSQCVEEMKVGKVLPESCR